MCKANNQHVYLQVSKINSIVTWMTQWSNQAVSEQNTKPNVNFVRKWKRSTN